MKIAFNLPLKPRTKAWLKENLEAILVAFVLAMLIRTYVIQAFRIPTGSMIPTLKIGDRLIASKYIYRFEEPQRGDVIIFRCPDDPDKEFVKRLVGLPGEDIEIRQGKIYINGEICEEPRISEFYYYNQGPFGGYGQVLKVPEDSYFVLGDNSGNSRDSRYWGYVPKEMVNGKVWVVYWPLSKIRRIP